VILRSLLGSPALARAASRAWALLPVRLRLHVLRRYPRPSFRVGVLAIVVSPDGGVLLLRHRFRAGRPWGLPGGWLEPGESPAAGLRRELGEELDLEVDGRELELVRVTGPEGQPHVEILYLVRARVDAVPPNPEFDAHAVFAPHELPRDMPERHRRILEELAPF
jgi:ADP-ribose pyrophosphatase YjhB (NUDIX family)